MNRQNDVDRHRSLKNNKFEFEFVELFLQESLSTVRL